MASPSISVQIHALLQEPWKDKSAERAVDFINAHFSTLKDLDNRDNLSVAVGVSKQVSDKLITQLTRSGEAVNAFRSQAHSSVQEEIYTAQELSLLRHSLSDELANLVGQLESSLSEVDRERTFLEDLESLHRKLKELGSVKGYVQVVQHALTLSESAVKQVISAGVVSSASEYGVLSRFVDSVRNTCSPVEEVTGQQQLHILTFLESVREKTWSDMKNCLVTVLLSAAEKLGWPQPIDYLSTAPEDRKQFEIAFQNSLTLQSIGRELRHGLADGNHDREGLYPLQALITSIVLRFKYHFEGARQTNRLDKPEWFFTHILNISHEHRPFMEKFVQALLSSTEYRDINVWREFTFLLLPLVERKLQRTIPSLLSHPPVLAHTIYEALAFDSALREEGFDLPGTTASDKSAPTGRRTLWQGLSSVVLGRSEWFETWMEGERQFAMDQYLDIISSTDAWMVMDENGEGGEAIMAERDLRPTNSARRVKALVEQVTDRYSPLPLSIHRIRFLISVQLPILEAYHSRISSSLDAFETLSSSLMRAVPGALGSVGVSGESMGRANDPQRLTSGVEGVQRLCKALISARYIAVACEAWGEDLFFLELWSDVNRQVCLRSRVKDAPALPNPNGSTTDTPEGTIFDELVAQYDKLAERADDIIIQSICGEVEAGLRAHFINSSTQTIPYSSEDKQGDIAIAPSLLGPLALLSSDIAFLHSILSAKAVTSLYRRIASRLSSHILQRQIFYRGRGRISLQEGKVIEAESELWVETCQIALARSDRARAEAPWRKLLQASRLVGAEGDRWQKAVDATFGVTGDQDWEEVMLETIGIAELNREEVCQVLRAREDCGE